MAVPTEILNDDLKILRDDLKILRDDLHKAQIATKDDINDLKIDIAEQGRRIDVSLVELKAQLSANLNGDLKVFRDDLNKVHLEIKDTIAAEARRNDARLSELKTQIGDDFTRLREKVAGDIQQIDATLVEFMAEIKDGINDLKVHFTTEVNRVQTKFANEVSRIDVSAAKLETQVDFSKKVAVWGITIIAASLITGVTGGIWWASKIDSRVETLESRFGKVEASLTKILEQTRPK